MRRLCGDTLSALSGERRRWGDEKLFGALFECDEWVIERPGNYQCVGWESRSPFCESDAGKLVSQDSLTFPPLMCFYRSNMLNGSSAYIYI